MLYFDPSKIKDLVKTERNLTLSFRYVEAQCVESIEIKELAANNGYLIHGLVNRNGYENECRLHVDQKMRIKNFSCDCPYCSDFQACAHIGALLAKINQIQPKQFPFSYHKGISEEEATDVEKQYEQYQKQMRQLQEEREKRYEEERRKREEAKRLELLHQQRAYMAQMIRTSQEQLIQQMMVNPSGLVHLQLLYEGASTSSYEYGVRFGLKVGIQRMYVIKNVTSFWEDVQEKKKVRYGKELSFVHDEAAFDEDGRLILHFLHRYFDSAQSIYGPKNHRSPLVERNNLRDLYETASTLSKEACEFDCIEKKACFKIKAEEKEEDLYLELNNHAFFALGYFDESGLYQVENHTLIHYCFDERGIMYQLLERFSLFHGELHIARADLAAFNNYIWRIAKEYVELQSPCSLLEVEELDSLTLYGDMDEMGQMSLRIEGKMEGKLFYGFDPEIKNKPLDLELVETYIKNFASIIDPQEHVAYLPENDDSTYSFIKDGLPFLQDYCEIYVSDALRKLGSEHHVNLQAGIRIKENLLEVSLESSEINKEELFDVLRAYRRKKKYHRLRNGHLLCLDAVELEGLETLVDTLQIKEQDVNDGKIQVPLYRAFSLDAADVEDKGLHLLRAETLQSWMRNFQHQDVETLAIPCAYEHILRDYQIDGVKWLKLMNQYGFGAILADDMGLGKTLQVIALLDSEQGHGPSIVITPSSLLLNWEDELHKFAPHLQVHCIMGNAQTRKLQIQAIQPEHIVITSYDYLRRDVDDYQSQCFHYIVLDEAQYIKNQKSKNAQCVKSLHSTHKLALSGTPIENSLAELWSIFDFLMKGYLYSYPYFAKAFEKPIVQEHDETTQANLKRMVEPFILRRTKKAVLTELPDKIEHTLMISFQEEEQKLYLANLMQVSRELQEKLQMGTMDRFQVLSMLTRLRQLCCEPRILYENIQNPSSKLQACMELLLSLKESNQKVLLFSSFTSVLELIEVELEKYHFSYLSLTGANSKEERRHLVQQFQAGSVDVFLISLKAGGTGLNLTKAEAVIHYDPWWNRSAQNQATDRAYRMGQEKNVQVFQLIMKDSIEEKIQKLQMSKQNLADTFVEQSDGSITTMDEQQLMELFSL